MKKTVSCILAFVSLCTLPVSGLSLENAPDQPIQTSDTIWYDEAVIPDKKVYNTSTLEDDFADDSVLVTLSKEKSLEKYVFTPEDFPEMECAEVVDLDPGGQEQMEVQQAYLQSLDLTPQKLIAISQDTTAWKAAKKDLPKALVNYSETHEAQQKISKIQRSKPGEQNVWEVVKELLPEELLDCDGSGLWLVNAENYHKTLNLKLKNPGKENVLKAIRALEKREDVLSAEPNAYYQASMGFIPSDTDAKNQWAIEAIDLDMAWNIPTSTGYTQVTVAVIDSGLDANHRDLKGRVSTTLGANYVNDGYTHLQDPLGHGTDVAGVIGANGNNLFGIAGIVWNANLVSLRILNTNGQGKITDAIAAINYAKTKNIPIINGSYTGLYEYSAAEHEAIKQYPGLMVFAAGNRGDNTDLTMEGKKYYPASYESDRIISVLATDEWDELQSNSNYGVISVDIGAPGNNIRTIISGTPPENGESALGWASETSIAAPHVTGVAALIKSKTSNSLSSAQIRNIILNTADEVYDLETRCSSGGRLNAYRALCAAMESANKAVVIAKSDSVSIGQVTGGVEYARGAKVTLRASSLMNHFVFDGWYQYEPVERNWIKISTSSTYTFTASNCVTLKAVFRLPVLTVTAGEGGTATGEVPFVPDREVTLTASPAPGYYFDGWYALLEGGYVNKISTSNPYTFTWTGWDLHYEARFIKRQ